MTTLTLKLTRAVTTPLDIQYFATTPLVYSDSQQN